MSVYKNMAFGLENSRMPRDEIDRKVREAAEMLQITDYLQRRPRALSGGQPRRVAIGRAIVRDPKAFLFDETLLNLHAELRVVMRKELAAPHNKIGGTMIYVTHDQIEAMTLAERIVVLKDGRIMQVGPPLELYNTPQNLFVAGFIGSPRMNLIEAEITDGPLLRAGAATVRLPPDVPVKTGDRVTFGFWPEHIEMVEDPADSAVTVELAEHLGGETYLYCNAGGLPQITVHRPGQLPFEEGMQLHLQLVLSHLQLFDAEGQVIANGLGHD